MLGKKLSVLSKIIVTLTLFVSIGVQAAQSQAPYKTAYRYSAMGLKLGVIQPDADTDQRNFLAQRYLYGDSARPTLVTEIQSGNLVYWLSEDTLPKDWSNFEIFSTQVFEYDNYGRKIKESLKDKYGDIKSLTQYSYNDKGLVQCKAVRMNKNAYSSLPASACNLGAAGAEGNDRITRYTYNNLDQILSEERAVGTPLAQVYVTNTYDGYSLKTQTDANGNKTELKYDEFSRLTHRYYPSATAIGSVNYSDYNQYDYDLNNNITMERKRNGKVVYFQFDNNNRMIVKDYVDNTKQKDIYYNYDLTGLQLSARFESLGGRGIYNSYNGFGEVTSFSNDMGNTQSIVQDYDANGNRTSLTYLIGTANDTYLNQSGRPSVIYDFDGLNRMSRIDVKIGTYPQRQLVYKSYGFNGKRSGISRGGVTTTYAYDNGVQLNNFKQSFANYNYNLSTDYTFNQARQIATLKQQNSMYFYSGDLNKTGTYVPDGLNRYQSIAGQPLGYDANSNLTNDGSFTFTYDDENRLLTANNGSILASFVYDPNGRLYRSTINGTVTEFQYAGDALVAEYDGSGAVKKRYVHGDQVDEPLVQYNETRFGVYDHVFLASDHQGSIIALSNYDGSSPTTFAYDAYGIPRSSNVAVSRFGYTGQQYFPDIGLNYYKARWYSPKLGRFLQTDPIGYKDNMNLYAYVGNDPANMVDHSGKYAELNWTSSNSVILTIPYTIDSSSARAAFSNWQLEAQVAKDFSGTFNVNGSNISITARAVAVSGTTQTNNIKIHPTTVGVTQSGRAETNSVGGNKITMGAGDDALVASHELGHAAGAGDQYAGGTGANGQTLSADVPGNPNVMRDLGGGANNQTAGEIVGASTNSNSNSANGMSSGIYRICSGMGAQAGGCN